MAAVVSGCGSKGSDTDSTTASTLESETTTKIKHDFSASGNDVPELCGGASEFVGPWAYCEYAIDEDTAYIYHEVYDDYVPVAGDILITGNDEDILYCGRELYRSGTGIRFFPYGEKDITVYNGHVLYIADVSDDGVLTCYEGNAIAPGQDLDAYDDDYVYLSSIDIVEIDFYTSETLTADKPAEKQIRTVIQTNFTDDFVDTINSCAADILSEFNENPSSVRNEILALYPYADINWCGLFIHYLLLDAVDNY